MFTKFRSLIFGVLLAVAGVAGASAFYVGFDPTTNLSGFPGIPVATGQMPTLSGAGCGTLATVQASEVGGGGIVQFTANATTCTITLTVPIVPRPPVTVAFGVPASPTPVPNGLFCVPVDETHVATAASQTAHTTTSCTVSLTGVTSGDLILVEINGF